MILIFGGTTEGRLAAEVADKAGKPFLYSTLEAGQKIASAHAVMLHGALDAAAIEQLCRQKGVRLIVDAAHPFAGVLHKEIHKAATEAGIPVVRLERNYPPRNPRAVWCKDWEEALRKLEESRVERLLVLTGVKSIARMRDYRQKHPETIFRILDRESSRRIAAEQGVGEHNLVYYGRETDPELLQRLRPEAIITKESGESGGFEEKLEAAFALGIAVFVIERPALPEPAATVNGRHGLRRAIERYAPGFFELRSGFTTGACATAAAKGALLLLLNGEVPEEVEFELPDGELMSMPLQSGRVLRENCAEATTVKDAGDDPDTTNGCHVVCRVEVTDDNRVVFEGGEGIGTVTLPGTGIEPGEPAINPVPRAMIEHELRRVLPGKGFRVTVSVPGGEELALRTFNPRIGIKGGISIIGTSGIVSPFSNEAFTEAMRREMQVARATGCTHIMLNSGARSERLIRSLYPEMPQQAFVHYGNAVGEAVSMAGELGFGRITIGVMIGKAVKLAEGNTDTHSHKVTMNREFLKGVAREAGCSEMAAEQINSINMATELWDKLSPSDSALFADELTRRCRQVCSPLAPGSEVDVKLLRNSQKR